MLSVPKIFLFLVLSILISARADGSYPSPRSIVNPFICKPGTSIKIDCNRCTCGSTPDVMACTRMACNLKPDQCIPGSYFQIDGQLCRCPDCGYKWHSDCFASNQCWY